MRRKMLDFKVWSDIPIGFISRVPDTIAGYEGYLAQIFYHGLKIFSANEFKNAFHPVEIPTGDQSSSTYFKTIQETFVFITRYNIRLESQIFGHLPFMGCIYICIERDS